MEKSETNVSITEWIAAWHVSANQILCSTAILIFACGVTGPRLNIKTFLATYGDFHVEDTAEDKTAVRTSYL